MACLRDRGPEPSQFFGPETAPRRVGDVKDPVKTLLSSISDYRANLVALCHAGWTCVEEVVGEIGRASCRERV